MKLNQTASSIVYTPQEVATLGFEYLQYKHDHKELAIDFPVIKMRNRVYPLAAGEVMSIIARPGHMKTGLMMYWARQRAALIKEKNLENRVTIYATWEQSIEELNSFYIAAEQKISVTKMAKGDLTEEDFKKALDASAKRAGEPLFFIGHSVVRKSGRKPITIDFLADGVDSIQQKGFEVDSLYLDYLQRIPPSIEGSPVVAYSKTMDDIKNLALGLGIPVTVGVQASREVEDKTKNKLPIPEVQHAQWTSNIEQSSDRVLSLVRPRKYRKEGEQFGSIMVSGQSQLLISILKQKLGESDFAEWVSFNPMYNKLTDNEQEVLDG